MTVQTPPRAITPGIASLIIAHATPQDCPRMVSLARIARAVDILIGGHLCVRLNCNTGYATWHFPAGMTPEDERAAAHLVCAIADAVGHRRAQENVTRSTLLMEWRQ